MRWSSSQHAGIAPTKRFGKHCHCLKKGVRNFLDAVVYRLENRDLGEPPIPVIEPPAPGHIGNQRTGQQQTTKNKHHAQTGHVFELLPEARNRVWRHRLYGCQRPTKIPSSSPISHNSTQMVIASGSQTSRPVSRYFLSGTESFLMSNYGKRTHLHNQRLRRVQHQVWKMVILCR